MTIRKILYATSLFTAGVLSVFPEAGAMQRWEEPSDGWFLAFRNEVAWQGIALMPFGPESMIEGTPRYPGLQRIFISACMEALGGCCFAGLQALSHIAFEAGSRVTCMNTGVFQGSALQAICIPAPVKKLGKCCFSHCSSLTCVTFSSPSQLAVIGEYTFSKTALSFLNLPFHPSYDIEVGICPFDESSIVRICIGGEPVDPQTGLYAGTGIVRDVTIHQELPSYCFASCRSLTSATFKPDFSPATIESYVFYRSGLRSVTIPASVETIMQRCFSACTSLAFVAFDAGSRLTRIEPYAFCNTALPSIVIPASVETIMKRCFAQCQFLISFSFEASSRLTEMGEGVFFCSNLRNIAVPAGVTALRKECFFSCPFLIHVTFGAGSQLKSVCADAFSRSPQAQVLLPDRKNYSSKQLSSGWTLEEELGKSPSSSTPS
ncbi:MAG: leucine-rich repeat domain-containing protein [Holosporales bacterium]|nr:leucine-rich repeat domain-containing protein [Holosporales bacterium]